LHIHSPGLKSQPVKQVTSHNDKRHNSTAACETGAPRDQHTDKQKA